MQTYTILGFGSPFDDRTAIRVDESFLESHHLIKGLTTVTNNQQDVDKTWNSLSPKPERESSLGGSGTNVIKALAQFEKCALFGKIGNDKIGEKIHQRLNDIGITSLLSKGERGNGTVNCFITSDAERTMHAYLGASEEFSKKDIRYEYFHQNVKHLHIEGYAVYSGDTLKKSVKYAQRCGATSSIDLASANIVEKYREKFEKVKDRVDFIFGNRKEVEALTQIKDIQEALEGFEKQQTVVATVGSNGCWVKNKGESEAIHHKALKVEVENVTDTTGAGDFFLAGFLYEALQGNDVFKCVATGNLFASRVIQEIGAELPPEKWVEIKQLMGKV